VALLDAVGLEALAGLDDVGSGLDDDEQAASAASPISATAARAAVDRRLPACSTLGNTPVPPICAAPGAPSVMAGHGVGSDVNSAMVWV
jgi:hypothetical protein